MQSWDARLYHGVQVLHRVPGKYHGSRCRLRDLHTVSRWLLGCQRQPPLRELVSVHLHLVTCCSESCELSQDTV